MDLTTLLPWVAGLGALFLAAFAVFGFFVLRFIWRTWQEVERAQSRQDVILRRARLFPRSSSHPSSARQHSERVRADVEAFDRDFERRFNRSRAL